MEHERAGITALARCPGNFDIAFWGEKFGEDLDCFESSVSPFGLLIADARESVVVGDEVGRAAIADDYGDVASSNSDSSVWDA